MSRFQLSVAALAATALIGCTKDGASASGGGSTAALKLNPGAVKVEFFVMSQCPYGVQVENGIKDAVDKLGADVDYQVDFIGSEANGQQTSMHGPDEVAGDIAQLCVNKHSPGAFTNFLACQNKNARDVAKTVESCAGEAKANYAEVKGCIDNGEGKKLLSESFARAAAKGAQGSPTMFIAGKPYNGRRDATSFLKAICAEYTTKPATCANLPEAPKVNVTLITDSRCAECNADRLLGMLKSQIGNPVVTQLDYTTAEGRKAFDALPDADKQLLPIVLFDDTVKADQGAMGTFARYLRPLGTWQTLAIGASFQPACANEGGCSLD
jgi:hypothetical protein